jgi:PEP-CTERM motif
LNVFRIAAVAASVLSAPAALHAATVVPTAAVNSSHYPGFAQQFAIDEGGNSANTDWAAFLTGAGSFVDLALGGSFNLVSARVVDRVTSGGGNGSFVGGTLDYTTSFSLQGISALGGTLIGSAQSFNFATPSGPTDYASFTHDVTLTPFSAQFVRYTVLATNGVNPGLSGISFLASAIPEPSAWAMMIAGFGLVGAAARRRARTSVTYA